MSIERCKYNDCDDDDDDDVDVVDDDDVAASVEIKYKFGEIKYKDYGQAVRMCTERTAKSSTGIAKSSDCQRERACWIRSLLGTHQASR